MNLNRPIRNLILCGLLLLVAIAGGAAVLIGNLRNSALSHSERELKNTALILAEQIDRSFQSLDSVQRAMADMVQSRRTVSIHEDLRQLSGEDVHRALTDKISGLSYVAKLLLIDAEGRLANFSGRRPELSSNIADQHFFKAAKAELETSSFVSEPVRDGAGTWNVYLARRIAHDNGDFAGLILASIDLSYFQKLFGSIVLGEYGSIALYRSDGVLLTRYPHKESVVGKVFTAAKNALGASESGSVRYFGQMEGKDRILAAHRLSHFPMHVSVSADTDMALSGWRAETRALIAIAVLSSTIIAVVFFLIVRQLSGRHALDRTQLNLERQKLDTAINHMSQGLLLFDAFERIVVCNRRYIDMHKLSPDIVKPGLSFRDLILHRKEIGTFNGDIEAYRSSLLNELARGQPCELTVQTPDRRSIRIINQPLRGGGWVATHEDITERQHLLNSLKRSEVILSEQKLRLDVALNNMNHGLCMFDAEGRIILFNSRYAELMGQPAEYLQGLSLLDLFKHRKASGAFPDDPDEFFANVLKSVREGKTTTREMARQDGITLRVIDQPMQGGGWVATYEDVTEQRQAERDRDRNRAFLDLIIDNVPSAIFVKNASDRTYLLVNRGGERFWGVSRQFMVGKTADQVFPEAEARRIEARDNELLQTGQARFEEREILTPSDGIRSISSRRLMIRNENDAAQYVLGVIEDVTERKAADARVAKLAHYDSLTDLPNRTLFREQLERELSLMGGGGQLAVLYLDLDHFKRINDTLGHPAGDELLKRVAQRLRNCLRDCDLIARLGGDEFAIVQTGLKHPKAAEVLAQRLRESVTAVTYDLGGHQTTTDLSIGIALAPGDGKDIDELIKHADLALYGAKAEGRASYRYYEPEMNARMKRRRRIEIDLQLAMSNGEFDIHYQPVLDLKTGALTGCEALLRWRHPERGMVPPLEFIPIAEEAGLIDTIGEWVLRRACAEAITWPKHIKIAVNISPVQFRNPTLGLVIAGILAASGLSARRLELEVTESVLMQNNDATLATLHQIRELGVRIAMDDFGTGYSSLSYLRRFPFDKIKIDRSFVSDLTKRADAKAIVQAVLDLARSLKMTTTAEGVETPEQRKVLESIGCDEMQGYLLSPAVPASQIIELFASIERRIRTVGVGPRKRRLSRYATRAIHG